jgi:hypothetical protein
LSTTPTIPIAVALSLRAQTLRGYAQSLRASYAEAEAREARDTIIERSEWLAGEFEALAETVANAPACTGLSPGVKWVDGGEGIRYGSVTAASPDIRGTGGGCYLSPKGGNTVSNRSYGGGNL